MAKQKKKEKVFEFKKTTKAQLKAELDVCSH